MKIVLDFDTNVNKFIEIFPRVACWEFLGRRRSNVVNFNSKNATLLGVFCIFNDFSYYCFFFLHKNGVRALSKLCGCV